MSEGDDDAASTLARQARSLVQVTWGFSVIYFILFQETSAGTLTSYFPFFSKGSDSAFAGTIPLSPRSSSKMKTVSQLL